LLSKVPDEEFSVAALVRRLIAETSLRGPRELGDKATEMVPAKHLRDALRQAMPHLVRYELQHDRRYTPPAAATSRQARTGEASERMPGRNVNSARSSKAAAIREGWRKVITGQFHVGGKKWEVLADCSYEQVVFMAGERREKAAKNSWWAGRFTETAQEMRKHGVNRVGDLPEDVLRRLFTIDDEDAA
jgi:hypothetical protein